VAIALVGASMWVKDNPTHKTVHIAAQPASTQQGDGIIDSFPGHPASTQTVADQTLADTRARYLRFLALAVVVIALASIPILRQREQGRA
jgi:hypothetical protein